MKTLIHEIHQYFTMKIIAEVTHLAMRIQTKQIIFNWPLHAHH